MPADQGRGLPDAEARQRSIHARRYLRTSTDAEGAWHLHMREQPRGGAAEGCAAGTWLENDHRVDWATSHFTVLDLLDRLCSHHHDLTSMDNWALVEGRGKRPFAPPDDPRHPRHAHAPPVAAA